MSQQSTDSVKPTIDDDIKFLGEENEEGDVLDLPSDKNKEKDKPEKKEKEDRKADKESEEESEEQQKSESDESEDDEDELKELEEELEEPSEDKLELTTPVRRKEILAKYPNIFKDFPYLEKAYYREQQFTEIVPTIEDARVAVQKAEVLDNFEREILSGNLQAVLDAAKTEDVNSFNKIVDNYLPSLQKVDERAFHHVIGGIIKNTISLMVTEGRRMGENGQPLLGAAEILNQYVFGTSQFVPHKPLSQQPTEKDDKRQEELNKREQQIIENQIKSTQTDLQSKVDNTLRATIEGHIDPKQSMTDYVRRNAIREAKENLENLIEQDTRFYNLLDKMWERAVQEGFSKVSTDRIKSAYLSKARTLLPTVIKQARNNALKGMGKRVKDDTESSNSAEIENRGPITRGAPRSQNSGKIVKAADIPKKMSTLDFLNSD